MTLKRRAFAITLLTALMCVGTYASDFQPPNPNLARRFFEDTTVSLTPVYGVMKNKSDHVATVHGFVDNAQICSEFIDLLNKTEAKVFTCLKLNDGALK